MNKKKKQRTIRACRELARKYRDPQGEYFFTYDDCLLCKIHFFRNFIDSKNNCLGCPLANKDGKKGCIEFKSFNKAYKKFNEISSLSTFFYEDLKTPKEFIKRAEFFEKIIPILERIPAERFTKKGWRYFDELNRNW